MKKLIVGRTARVVTDDPDDPDFATSECLHLQLRGTSYHGSECIEIGRLERGNILILLTKADDSRTGLHHPFTPAGAREVAASLIRLADEAEREAMASVDDAIGRARRSGDTT